jgi:hypothetical protein
MRKIILIVSGLLGASLFSQFPEFFQQYTQRLGGRLDEVNLQVANVDKRAAAESMTRYDYVRHFMKNSDGVIRREGDNLADILGRQIALARAYNALHKSAPLWRAAVFSEHFDPDIAFPTFDAYRPAIPLTAEGGIYSGTGFFTSWLIMYMFVGRRRRRQKAKRDDHQDDLYA